MATQIKDFTLISLCQHLFWPVFKIFKKGLQIPLNCYSSISKLWFKQWIQGLALFNIPDRCNNEMVKIMNNEIATYPLWKIHVTGNYKSTCIGLTMARSLVTTICYPILINVWYVFIIKNTQLCPVNIKKYNNEMLLRFSTRHGKHSRGSLHSYDKHMHSESRWKGVSFDHYDYHWRCQMKERMGVETFQSFTSTVQRMSFEIGQPIVVTSDIANLSLHLAPKLSPNPFALYKILLSTLNPIQLNEK